MSLLLTNISLSLSGTKLVDDVSIEVCSGEVVGLLGPNGAGKTTTFNILIGQLTPDYGDVVLDDKFVTNLPMPERSRMGIGYLPQEPSIFRNLNVIENLEIALSQSIPNNSHRRIRREQLIADFSLGAFLDRKGFQLSGGERRRLEVARALASGRIGPRYLLLDEPFAGVDPLAVDDLQGLIDNLRNLGMGILITDHNVRETLAITNRSYILSDGKILASGTSKEVANNKLVKRYYLGDKFQL